MKRKLRYAILLGAALLVTGCGTAEIGENKQGNIVTAEEETVKTVSGREIIAELEQTAKETPKRDKKVLEITESEDFNSGILGEPSKALEEDMAVQAIEFFVVIEAVEKVYGSHEQFDEYGVIFLENQMQEAEQSGIWLGVKELDEKVDALIRELQPKVDAGEILAEPIYIYRSPHTQMELNELQDEVAKVLQPMAPKINSGQLWVDTITGDIEIGHDFLTEVQQVELREKFANYTINFEQVGRMVAEPGESIIIYPDDKFTTEVPTEGGYIVQVEENRFLVAGGKYGAIYFTYPGEIEQVKVGQRVEVESAGGIAESYPGQGTAKYIEVLPEYKPETAKLTESEVVQQVAAIAYEKSNWVPHLESVTYDEQTKKWHVSISQDEETYEIEIQDK